MAAKHAHVVLDYSQQPVVMRCLHCQAATPLSSLPMPISVMLRKLDGFTKLHQDCKAEKP